MNERMSESQKGMTRTSLRHELNQPLMTKWILRLEVWQ